MAFCKYCGATLEEGQTCTCEKAQAAAQQATQAEPVAAAQQPQAEQAATSQTAQQAQQAASAAAGTAVAAAKSIIPYAKEYFVNPGKAVRQVVEQDNMTLAIVLTVVRVLAMGLAVYGLLRKICSAVMDTMLSAMGLAGALTGSGLSGAAGTSISASFLGSLLWGIIMALIGMALFILMIFALVKIQKGSVSIKAIYEASAANGILTSALLLVAFILSFLSINLCIAFLALAGISWMIMGVLTAQLLCQDNVSGKFWLLYFVGVVLVVVIGYYVMPGLFLNAVGSITVTVMGVSQTLQSAIDQAQAALAQAGGIAGILQGLLSELM